MLSHFERAEPVCLLTRDNNLTANTILLKSMWKLEYLFDLFAILSCHYGLVEIHFVKREQIHYLWKMCSLVL